MRTLLSLALRSAWNRRFALSLTVVAVALATLMLVGVERLRGDVRAGFMQSVSGTDLIVGPRSSPVQLLLYSVFRVGQATSNVSWRSIEAIGTHPGVAWVVPLSLGDSHRGFAVLGTSAEYFDRFRYGDRLPLAFSDGKPFAGLFEAVVGADVARTLGYRPGDRIALQHGTGDTAIDAHADKPFVVTGVLARTGTPVDRTVHVSLESMEALHLDWQGGAPIPGFSIPAQFATKFDLKPKSVTAALVGLRERGAVFGVQRFVNDYRGEALMGVLPGVALDDLWNILDGTERALLAISTLVAAVSLMGLVATILASLNERRRELAILRSLGAGPRHVLLLLAIEGTGVVLAGVVLGLAALAAAVAALAPVLKAELGVALSATPPDASQLALVAAIVLAGLVASLIPALRAYRLALADGLAPRI